MTAKVTPSLPKVLVVSGQGINCERESMEAFRRAGGEVERIHVNDLAKSPEKLRDAQVLMLPGGFSYGDHTGSGNALAMNLKGKLLEAIMEFISQDKLVLGICNGFQVLTQLLRDKVPLFGDGGLAHNERPGYIDRWVDLKVPKEAREKSPWLKGIHQMPCPIAHGEGRFVASEAVLDQLEGQGQVAFKYTGGEIIDASGEPVNPNGSMRDIAGITNETGKVLGMMPHPERAMYPTQHPQFHLLKEKARRSSKELPEQGPGQVLFNNSIKYFTGKE